MIELNKWYQASLISTNDKRLQGYKHSGYIDLCITDDDQIVIASVDNQVTFYCDSIRLCMIHDKLKVFVHNNKSFKPNKKYIFKIYDEV